MTLSVTIYFPAHCGHTWSPDVSQGRLWVEPRPRRLRPCGPVPFAGVSLKPDRKTEDKTAKINSDGRALCMTARPHTMSAAHQTVTLLRDRRVGASGRERIQEAQLSQRGRAMPRVVE